MIWGSFTAAIAVFSLAVQAQQAPAVKLRRRTVANPSGQVCRTITYEGLQDRQPIPAFNGITASGWVAGISAAIPGGTAQFINSPAPGYTVAVFLTGQSDTITFPTPMATVSFYYATGVATTVTAFDANNNVVAQLDEPSNWDQIHNYYSNWTQVVLPAHGNQISSIAVTGATKNFYGIDNLTYCVAPVIDSVEMTQSIQQWQSLTDLKASLANGGSLPVPVVAGKPGAMRVYLKTAFEANGVNVNLTIPNVFQETRTIQLVPGCTPPQQRIQATGCPSTDFYFTPPPGAWTANLSVTDATTGDLIDHALLNFTSQNTRPLNLTLVPVCDDTGSTFGITRQKCGDLSSALAGIDLLKKLTPSAQVTSTTRNSIFQPHPGSNSLSPAWWQSTIGEMARLYAQDTGALPATSLTDPYNVYYGVVRDVVDAKGNSLSVYGGFSDIKSHQAASQAPNTDFYQPIDVTAPTIAHETGHTLNLRHTNSPTPLTPNNAPGCWAFASAQTFKGSLPQTDWPWAGTSDAQPGSNLIQSPTGLEVPFDVFQQKAMNPNVTYEVMSYCHPRWTAPQRAADEFNTLASFDLGSASEAGAARPELRTAQPHTVSTQPFWMITGTIPAAGVPQLGAIFQSSMTADTGGGSGAYSLEVQNASTAVLFTRHFDLGEGQPEADNLPSIQDPAFTQLVPVTAGAARIVLKDPNGVALTSVTLGGVAPAVAITNPTAVFDGTTAISWTINDPDSTDFTSRIDYSADNGGTWQEVAVVPDSATSFFVDFGALPGTNGKGLIRVLVSDGVNTGQATSVSFSIARKTPSLVKITSPIPNFAQSAANSLLLSGIAYDVDDGILSGNSLAWSSNLQGAIGNGAQLSVNLQPGVHTVTLTATDSDNNAIAATTTVTIAGAPPQLSVSIYPLTAPPSSASLCQQLVVQAAPARNGAPLASAQYSIDGGNTYTNIPLSQLPFVSVIPGAGFIDLVASVTDLANQTVAESTSFFNPASCPSLAVPNVVGMTESDATTALNNAALPVGAVTPAASATVAAGVVIGQNPAAGAAIPPGLSDFVNLTVSSGTQVAIPNVVGQSQASASAAITAAGLTVGAVTNATSATIPAGSIVSETPAAGIAASPGGAVNLVVSTGAALAISTPSSLPVGTAGLPYGIVLTASGGSGTYHWSAPALPQGLSIDDTGTISGTPAAATVNPVNVEVTVTDPTYSTGSNRTYSLTVNPSLAITAPAALADAVLGASYTAVTAKATGGSGAYKWYASGLPPGMFISPTTGVISGRPASRAGNPYAVAIAVEDSNSASTSINLQLTVDPPGALNKCDVDQSGDLTVADVNQLVTDVLKAVTASDLNGDTVENILDIQIVINAVMGQGCAAR